MNEFHVTAFDGGGTTGWAHLVVDFRAFSRPENKVMRWLKHWECGEYTGPEEDQEAAAVDRIHTTLKTVSYLAYDVVGEDFELTQLIGGKNLLSPVRINAVLAWECHKRGVKYNLQARQLRTSVTPQRLNLFGFEGRWTKTGKGKDMFAAMQHAVTWLRRKKIDSRSRPWKLSDGTILNSYWDCDCSEGKPCDMVHPR